MKRRKFSEEHEIFRDAFRQFLTREAVPHYEQWEHDGMVSREVWRKAGENGFLCPWLPEKYGGSGADFLYSVVIMEECARARNSGFAISLHNDVVAPYIASYGSEEQNGWPRC
jgi:acyl-CoA dehydrogenase